MYACMRHERHPGTCFWLARASRACVSVCGMGMFGVTSGAGGRACHTESETRAGPPGKPHVERSTTNRTSHRLLNSLRNLNTTPSKSAATSRKRHQAHKMGPAARDFNSIVDRCSNGLGFKFSRADGRTGRVQEGRVREPRIWSPLLGSMCDTENAMVLGVCTNYRPRTSQVCPSGPTLRL